MTRNPSTSPSGRRPRRPRLWQRLRDRLLPSRSLAPSDRDSLTLPPPSRAMQAFSALIFVLLGAGVMAFVAWNPFGVGFLPAAAQAPAAGAAASAPATFYQCPMHLDVVQEQPGDCPICGMDLVQVRSSAPATGSGDVAEREVLYWYAPMDPTYIRDEPGLSPMGMELVPKYASESPAGQEGVIVIDPAQVQNIGVVTAPVEIADISRRSRTVGILDFNADEITWVNTKFEGWIEKVHVNYVGEEVREGQPLFEIYSPELVTTQEEYLRALNYAASLSDSARPEPRRQAESLVRSTRERLAYWDITDEQIRRLESTRSVLRLLTVTSPADGVIAEVMSEALEGMYVKPGMDLYKIADLSTIWVHADVYELDIPWIRTGQPAEISFRSAPDKRFRGRVLFIYPEVSRDTRTLKLCVEVPNPQRRLRAGMFADVLIHGPLLEEALVAPQSAVIRSGERNIAFVALGEGRFQPREVELGIKSEGDRIQIVDGLSAGERVVTQAQFMLDSESRIQEAIAQYRDRAQPKPEAAGPEASEADHD